MAVGGTGREVDAAAPVRDLRKVRVRVRGEEREHGPTPLTEDEERRARMVLFHEPGNAVADRGWARFPAYTPEERRRLVDVAARLSAHWGRQVLVAPEDQCALRLVLEGAETPPQP
ncbi:hypothetical protein [Streptomyces sp. NPDC007988]|uniref:hypothetical protein n=1 Tax=Streptomyces sp. NPDC007988 TaxID=3364802 RepID=UPI0036EBEF58